MLKITTKPILIALSVLAFGMSANADTFVVDNLKYETLSETECRVVGPGGDVSGKLVLPATVHNDSKEYQVVAVGGYAFQNNKEITSLVVSSSMKTLGYSCFSGAGLKSVELKEVESIEGYAFSGCELTELTIPASVTSISGSAFNCKTIKTLTFKDSETPISISDSWGSINCESLETLYYGRPFNENASNFRCDGATNLKTITFGKAVTWIPGSFAPRCSSLTKVNFGGNEQSINSYAFQSCTSLAEIEIPASCKTIGYASFDQCEALADIHLGTGVETIDSYAFSGCSPVDLVIPNNVTSIGGNSFRCTSIKNLTFADGDQAIAISDGWGSINFESLETLYYGRPFNENSNNFRPTDATNLKTITFGKAVTLIPGSFAPGCTALTKVNFGGNEQSIGANAFRSCSSLTEIEIPDSCKFIGYCSFDGCTALTVIDLGEGVETIDSYAFSGCSPVDLVIPNNVTSIGGDSFYCTSIKNLTIAEGDQAIAIRDSWGSINCESLETLYYGRPFNENSNNFRCDGATNLKTITFGKAVTYVPGSFAPRCSSLTKVNFGGNEQSINSYAFQSCTSLAEIEIPASCKFIGYSSFDGCTALTVIDLGEGVEKIDNYAFSGCSPVDLVIPNTVTSIGGDSFYCTSIKNLTFVEGDQEIALRDGWGSFNCESLETLFYGRPFNENSSNFRPHSAKNLKSIEFGKYVTYVPGSFAYECDALRDIKFNNNEQRIGSQAFQKCISLEQLRIPDACTQIGYAAFEGSGLKSVILPVGLKSIDSYAFNNQALTSINCLGSEPAKVNSGNSFSDFTYNNATLFVPEESVDTYKEAPVWNRFLDIQVFIIEGEKNRIKGEIRWKEDVSQIRFDWNTTGAGHHPEWEFTEAANNQQLENGVDYKVTWSDNIWPGTARLTVTGIGKYSGELTATFQIDKANSVPSDNTSHDISWYNNHKVIICEGFETPQPWTITLKHQDKRVAPIGHYRRAGTDDELTAEVPNQTGEYELWLVWPECELNYQCGPDVVGTYTVFDFNEQWAALKLIHKALTAMLPADMPQSENPLRYWNFNESPEKINGYNWHLWMNPDGSVSGFDLVEHGYVGQFPKELFKLPGLKKIALYNGSESGKNKITGNLSDIVAEAVKEGMPGLSTIEELYLQYNDLSGNIGAVASYMPNLKDFNVAYNRFTEAHPMVAQDVNVTYHHQHLDVIVPLYTSFTDEEVIKASLPEICTYKHGRYCYEYNVDNACNFNFVDNYWDSENTQLWSRASFRHIYGWDSDKDDYGYMGFNMTGSWAEAVFYGKSGDIFNVNQVFDDSYFSNEQQMKAVVTFDDYDVNWKDGLEVGDVQRTVSYITDNRFPNYVFNFTAANVVPDNVINVQDVALLINMVLQREEPATQQRVIASDPSEGMFFIDASGRICISSDEPVSAFEITLRGSSIPTRIEALERLGLSYRVHHGSDFSRLVVYTFDQQKSIPAGVLPIFDAGYVESMHGIASDYDGNRLYKPFSGYVTGIDDITAPTSPIVALNGGTLQFANIQFDYLSWRLISVQGFEVACGNIPNSGCATVDLSGIAPGIYLVETSAEGMATQTVKIIIK